jgi:ABC-type nitrate/sulfonate/bicarbonate transport system permease component
MKMSIAEDPAALRLTVPARPIPFSVRLSRVVFSPNAVRVASVVAFFIFWEWVGRRSNPIFMAPPSAIWSAGVELWQEGLLQKAMIESLLPFMAGLILTIVIGIGLGIMIALSRTMEYILDPFINALYAIPRIALVPLIILWAGLEFWGKVVILTSTAVFPVIVNTYAGIRDVRGSMLEIGKAYCASETQIFFKIILPAALPFIMTGIRLSVGMCIIGIVVAEFFTAISGLGGMIIEFSNVFATAKMFVPIIVIAILGVALTELVQWIERRLSKWRYLERARTG